MFNSRRHCLTQKRSLLKPQHRPAVTNVLVELAQATMVNSGSGSFQMSSVR